MSQFTLADLGVPEERPPEERVGTVVAGCRLERLLGRGGMGTVYLAQSADGQAVVVKFLAPEIANNVNLRARFQREWEALSKIGEHPNVVRVHGVHMQGPEPHLVMEFVEGHSLRRILQEHGRMPAADALRMARDVARGLIAIHGLGLIHRDLKPDNVILDGSGAAKIVDFGLAKDVFMTSLTLPGQLLGTAIYMAPEQWDQGLKEDARCDLFALGATLYHLVCGEPPFEGTDVHEISDACTSGDFRPPRELAPDMPVELELLVLQLLEPELRYRYGSAADVVADAELVLAGRPCPAPSLVDAGGRRFPLLGATRFSIGSQAGSAIQLADPGVSPRHAQLRREEEAFVLRNVKGSAGTLVGGEPLTRSRELRDGDVLKMGGVTLTFRDPRATAQSASPLGVGVARRAGPAPVVEVLVGARDSAAVLALLERLVPDPTAAAEAGRTLSAALGAQAQPILQARARLEAARPSAADALRAISGQACASPAAWLSWWGRARHSSPPQWVEEGPVRALRLRAEGNAQPSVVALDGGVATLVGRHPTCQVRLASELAERLQVTLLRLHQRLVFLAPAGGCTLGGVAAPAGFLEPGQVLELPGARLLLEAADAPPTQAEGGVVVDGLTFSALVEARHPSCVAGLVGLLREAQDGSWPRAAAHEVGGGDSGREQASLQALSAFYGERAAAARQLLPSLLGADAGADPAAWARLLEERRAGLPPQILPRGWLASTRYSPRT